MAAHPSISDPDRQETERLSNVMNRNVLARNVILSAMERTDPERLGNRRWHGTEQKNGTGAQRGSNRAGTVNFLYAARPQKTIIGPAKLSFGSVQELRPRSASLCAP